MKDRKDTTTLAPNLRLLEVKREMALLRHKMLKTKVQISYTHDANERQPEE